MNSSDCINVLPLGSVAGWSAGGSGRYGSWKAIYTFIQDGGKGREIATAAEPKQILNHRHFTARS